MFLIPGDPNTALFKYYPVMFIGVFQFLSICHRRQSFVDTLVAEMPRAVDGNVAVDTVT